MILDKTKVLLIEPPPLWKYGNQRSKGAFGNLKTDIRWPPIDLMVIAGYLRKNNVEVALIDAGGERLMIDKLAESISNVDARLIVINTSTTTIYHDVNIAERIKRIKPAALVGAIGVHVMALPEETLKLSEGLDFVVVSEPEIPILNLAKILDLPGTKGICYLKNSQIIKNLPESPISNLDELGMPAHDLVPLNIYKEPQLKRKPMTITMVSRGCINRCIFCSACFYGDYRLRSISNVMEELKWISSELGVKELKFYDDGITYNRKWAVSLFQAMIDEKIDLTWNTNLRADSIDLELAQLMKKAGCHTVNMGLESANQDILNNIKKNVTLEKMEQAVKYCKQAGLEVCGYFVIGLPGETLETVNQTVEFAKRLDLDLATFNVTAPHPGTEFFDFLQKKGFLKTKNWEKYDTNSLPVYDYPKMSAQDIYSLALKAYRHFYMRPGYFLKRLKRVNSLLEMKNLAENFFAFMENFIIKSVARDVIAIFKMEKK
ncbi:MAG: radical SAM protein [Candidatus Omnitrophica bacterium]|nr:radical SAM protein [Candidatus Omnitrophota bacterium]